MERLIEQAARQIGIDGAEIRRRNLIPPTKLPYTTPTHWVYDSGEFVRLMDKCIENSDWKGYAARQRDSKKDGKLRGRAVSYYIEFGGIFNDRMDLRFDPSGALTIYGGTHSHGQGHATVFAQIAHDLLGVPFEQIRYVQGDTAQVAIGRGTYGARSRRGRRQRAQAAADQMIEKGKKIAATMMEADAGDIEFKDGSFVVTGTDKAIALVDVAKATYAPMGPLTGSSASASSPTGSFDPDAAEPSQRRHVCEVEVDPETGVVTLDRYLRGRRPRPHPQSDDRARPAAGRRGAGHRPGADGAPGLRPRQRPAPHRQLHGLRHAAALEPAERRRQMEEIACKTNPLGVKGIGESGTIGAPPTIINAVIDALRAARRRSIDMPATPLRVWEAIQRAQKGKAA